MPASVLARANVRASPHADQKLPDTELLALWKELQAEITARRLAAGVGRKELTYQDIGGVLGITRQSVHTWVTGRINGGPLRRKSPRAGGASRT